MNENLPPLVGTLADLPEHVQKVVKSYARAGIAINRRAALAAQPRAGGEWKRVPVEPTEAMIAAANKLDWSSEDCDGTVHNVWNAMLAAAPTEAKPAQATVLTPAQRRELIDRAGDITDGLNQDDFADEIINQVIAAIKTGASNG